jgi:hypothetical protein
MRPHLRRIELEGVSIPVLDIDGPLKAETDFREKYLRDKAALRRLRGMEGT